MVYNTDDVKDFEEFRLEYLKTKEHWFVKWFEDELFQGQNLLSYRPKYYLENPLKFFPDLIEEVKNQTKWAYQRVIRGWDDRVVWSVDSWLNDIMPDILNKLRQDKQGVPGRMFEGMEPSGEHGDYSKEQYQIAQDLWDKELQKMIAAFVVAERLNNLEYDWKNKEKNEEKILMKIFNSGMDSFKEHYFSLWD